MSTVIYPFNQRWLTIKMDLIDRWPCGGCTAKIQALVTPPPSGPDQRRLQDAKRADWDDLGCVWLMMSERYKYRTLLHISVPNSDSAWFCNRWRHRSLTHSKVISHFARGSLFHDASWGDTSFAHLLFWRCKRSNGCSRQSHPPCWDVQNWSELDNWSVAQNWTKRSGLGSGLAISNQNLKKNEIRFVCFPKKSWNGMLNDTVLLCFHKGSLNLKLPGAARCKTHPKSCLPLPSPRSGLGRKMRGSSKNHREIINFAWFYGGNQLLGVFPTCQPTALFVRQAATIRQVRPSAWCWCSRKIGSKQPNKFGGFSK